MPKEKLEIIVNAEAGELFVPGKGLADCEANTAPFGFITESEEGITLSFEGDPKKAVEAAKAKFG